MNAPKVPFSFEVTEVEKTARGAARIVNEAYRPIFDAAAKLDEGSALNVTFDDEATANAAKSTVQALANEAGYTVRERRGSRVTHPDKTVTISLVKRPRQRKPADDAKTVAPAK